MECHTTIVVVEPSTILQEGLVKMIEESGYPCIGLFSVDQYDDEMAQAAPEPLFVIDANHDLEAMSDELTGLRARYGRSPIVVLSDVYSDAQLLTAIRIGAQAYVVKDVTYEVLISVIRLSHLRQMVLPAQAREFILGEHVRKPSSSTLKDVADRVQHLSNREKEVLDCLGSGSSNKAIARRCGITEATVKVHVKAILRKLQVNNRTEAAIMRRDIEGK